MMTIPFRPAPPPPSSASNTNNTQNFQSNRIDLQQLSLTTTFKNEFQLVPPPPLSLNPNERRKKLPPPRPPPPNPKIGGTYNKTSELKKPENQSINILANLFGGQSSNRTKTTTNKSNLGRKTESPPTIKSDEVVNNTSMELISFDSPPSSPQFSTKFIDSQRTSSANSFESNSLQSNSSGFSSGAISTLTNSGFEDDYFSLGTSSGCSSSNNNMVWQNIDPFSPPPPPMSHNDQSSFNSKQFQTNSYGDSTFYASTNELKTMKNTFPVEFDDSLSNGKSLLKPEPALTMPTIIRPGKSKPKTFQTNYEPMKSLTKVQQQPQEPIRIEENITNYNYSNEESYGIALFDFDAVQDGDLSLKVNDKIYLIRKIDNEWYYGKNKRGCEGIFPTNFINIVIPLKENTSSIAIEEIKTKAVVSKNISTTTILNNQSYTVKTMYDFIGEVNGDLTIRVSDQFEWFE